MTQEKIVFIGGGNLGSCLINGLIADGYTADAIHVVDPNQDSQARLASLFPINVHSAADTALGEATAPASIIVLAVKPQVMQSVIAGFKHLISATQPLIISVAAGLRSDTLVEWLGFDAALVRTMPNTPAMVGSAATALFATANTREDQRETAEKIMRSVGIIQWLDDENLMDAVTAVSGSGPAYFFRFMEGMEKAGVAMGLSQEQARLLTIETAFGAAKLALESPLDPASLRVQVTSPGGTTEQALNVFNENDIDAIIARALTAARDRSTALSAELSGKTADQQDVTGEA